MFDFFVSHFINHVPVWVWAMVAGAGAGVYALTSILGLFPGIKPYLWLFRLVSIIVFTFGVFMAGGQGVTEVWQQRIAAKQAEVDAATAKSKTANVKIKYVIREKLKVIHDQRVVVKHDIQRDAVKIDSECRVAPEAIKDLNEATK